MGAIILMDEGWYKYLTPERYSIVLTKCGGELSGQHARMARQTREACNLLRSSISAWPALSVKLCYPRNRDGDLAARFADVATQHSIRADLALIDAYDTQIDELERALLKQAKVDDPVTYELLKTIPGIGKVLGLILLYEIDNLSRIPEMGNFLSYSRLVRPEHESAGKKKGSSGKKIGNAHLKWAFSEAACLTLRTSAAAEKWLERQAKKRGKRNALGILEAKLGRAVYHVWQKQTPFNPAKFLGASVVA